MRRYKIITRILLILPIINFAFALPVAAQETRQVCGDVEPDAAITMSAKRVKRRKSYGICTLKGFPGNRSRRRPRLTMARWILLKWARARFNSRSCRNLRPSTIIWCRQRPMLPWTIFWRRQSPMRPRTILWCRQTPSGVRVRVRRVGSCRSTMKSFLSKVVSKLKFWRRISGPRPRVRDAVNAAQRGLQGLVDSGAYVSAPSPESQTF
jgi:hypothetical protein